MLDRKRRTDRGSHERPLSLDSMPSALHGDAIVVHTPRHWPRIGRARRFLLAALLIVVGLPSVLVLLINMGAGDRLLTDRIQQFMQAALGDAVTPTVEGVGVRLTENGRIAVEARGVSVVRKDTSEKIVGAQSVKLGLGLLPMLSGRPTVSRVEIDSGYVDAKYVGRNEVADNVETGKGPLLIKDIGPAANRLLDSLTNIEAIVRRKEVDTVIFNDFIFLNTGVKPTDDEAGNSETAEGELQDIRVERAELTSNPDRSITFDSQVLMAGEIVNVVINTSVTRLWKEPDSLEVQISNLKIGELIRQITGRSRQKFRLEGEADLTLVVKRPNQTRQASLTGEIELSGGELFMDGVGAELQRSRINFAFDTAKNSLEFLPSQLNVGKSNYNFNGGVIDLDSLPDQIKKNGFAFDLVVDEGVVAPSDSSEPPATVAMKVFARYLRDEKRINIDEFTVSDGKGALYSSASIQLTDTSPQVSFVANVTDMDTSTVKQLWPYWIARQARNWVHQNLFGGTVANGAIRLFIPKGLIAQGPDASMNGRQLTLDFDIENARFDVAGSIPPVRNGSGVFKLRGDQLELELKGGRSFFPSGRSVGIANGNFAIPDTRAQPLMADLDIEVSGDADAVAELVSYRPINALQRTPYKPEDFTGAITAKVEVTFGLILEQNPPEPDWTVDLDLSGVSVGPLIDGVKVTNATGKMFVDPQDIHFDTSADLDGISARIDFVEPLSEDRPQDRQRDVKLVADAEARAKFAPQLNDYVKGDIELDLSLLGDGKQRIVADLTKARLELPWIGWSKGTGVKASVSFLLDLGAEDSQNRVIKVSDVSLKGNGFAASGSLDFDDVGLLNADIRNATLARDDKFDVKINRRNGVYVINVNGRAVDLRSAIKHYFSDSEAASETESSERVELSVTAEKAIGFHSETVSPFRMTYSGVGSTLLSLSVEGTTRSGQPVRANGATQNGVTRVNLTSGDAGATGRIVDIYDKIQGGKLSVTLNRSNDGPYLGSVSVDDFAIVGEERLESIVSSKPQGGQSLNEAINHDLNVTRAEFQRGFARIDKGRGYLRISDGVVRGPEIGSTFQGTVYDANGNIDITGTFMPLYGVNRLFGEIPIVGAILGNGRDRGLIGITYRLSGKFEDPKLSINPISMIAPGIFRSMFQFTQGRGGAADTTTPSRPRMDR